MSEQLLNPYWALRLWNKAKEQFPNIQGKEDFFSHNLLCIEQQIAFLAGKHNTMSDEDVTQALAICGLKVVAALEKKGDQILLKDFSPEVEELANRCMATLHPDYNSEIAETVKKAWQTLDDEQYHYRSIGSVLRRLTDSCKFWIKNGGRKGYIKHVTSFLYESNLMPEDDRINFTIATKTALPAL